MNKRELIEAITPKFGDDKKTATAAVDAVLDAIQNAVIAGDRVAISGWGAFEMTHKPARVSRNPQTGEPVQVAEKWVPKFTPGGDFKDKVNEAGKAQAAQQAA